MIGKRGAMALDRAGPALLAIARSPRRSTAAHRARDHPSAISNPANIKVTCRRYGEGPRLRTREGDGAAFSRSAERSRASPPVHATNAHDVCAAMTEMRHDHRHVPAYMSPRAARGAASVDKRADLWAFGAVLFEMAYGRSRRSAGKSQVTRSCWPRFVKDDPPSIGPRRRRRIPPAAQSRRLQDALSREGSRSDRLRRRRTTPRLEIE